MKGSRAKGRGGLENCFEFYARSPWVFLCVNGVLYDAEGSIMFLPALRR